MAATNCPETPRQRMISMMYLVLTAMLALNVSVEILNAFVTVGDSMEKTNVLFSKKVESTYYAFEQAYAGNPEKVGPNWEKAKIVREETKKLVEYIDDVKYELLVLVEGFKGGEEEARQLLKEHGHSIIQKKDNYSIATNYFIGQSEDGTAGKAMELRNKIEAYQEKMLTLVDAGYREQLEKTHIDTKGTFVGKSGQEMNWQMYNFYHSITIADLVLLNKFQSEIQSAEFDMINYLMAAVSMDDFKFDNVRAKVVHKSTYVMQGDSYEAEVFVSAYDSHTELRADVRGANYIGDSGIVNIKFPATAIGPQKYTGTIYVKKETGEEAYPFSGEYIVAEPSATISPTNMNVFYIGVDNPVSISVPGASAESIEPTITGGGGATIKRATRPGEYIVNVKTQQLTKINVAANIHGKKMPMGSMDFRVKPIPPPKAQIGASDGGRIEKEILLAQGGLRVVMEGFDFPVTYIVTEFQMTFNTGGDAQAPLVARGNRFTPEMLAQINRLRRGNKVYIEGIRAKGPDGERAVANSQMIFTIQ